MGKTNIRGHKTDGGFAKINKRRDPFLRLTFKKGSQPGGAKPRETCGREKVGSKEKAKGRKKVEKKGGTGPRGQKKARGRR